MSWIPKKCVVVPIDFSMASEGAIQTALQLVAQPSDVIVLHVAMEPVYNIYGEFPQPVDPEQFRTMAQQHLNGFLQTKGIVGVTSQLLVGDPGIRITEFAAERHADLIVIPSHGYHGVKRILLGSVAERVLRHAPCEVLVLRRA